MYPHHGAATITAVKTRTIKGADKEYITLNVHATDLTIELPIENVELISVSPSQQLVRLHYSPPATGSAHLEARLESGGLQVSETWSFPWPPNN